MQAVVAVGVLLLLPSVLALPGGGHLLVEGPIGLPPGAVLEGTLLAGFSDDIEGLQRLTLTAREVRLYEYRMTYTVAQAASEDFRVAPPPEESRTTLTDFRMDLISTESFGWIGIYPLADRAQARLTSPGALRVEPADVSHLGNARQQGPADEAVNSAYPFREEGDPAQRHYQKTVPSPHMLLETAASIAFQGGAVLKVLGPDVQVRSNEREGALQTGFRSLPGAFREDEYRWVVMAFDEGTLEISTASTFDVAFQEPRASWSGPAEFRSLQGEFRTEQTAYALEKRAAVIEGDFTALLAPRKLTDRLVTEMDLQGNLASTTLQPQAAVVAPSAGAAGLTWPTLLFFGAVLAGGSAAAAVLATRRRRAVVAVAARRPEGPETFVGPYDGLHADDFIRLADEAAVERRWARALQWARQARQLAPTNGRVWADEGEYLFQLGLFEEALQAFAEASRLDGEEGYADYRGAQAAAAAGRPVDEVLAWLSRALSRSPDLVGDLELFKEFASLRGLPEYDGMVRKAYKRLGIDPAEA